MHVLVDLESSPPGQLTKQWTSVAKVCFKKCVYNPTARSRLVTHQHAWYQPCLHASLVCLHNSHKPPQLQLSKQRQRRASLLTAISFLFLWKAWMDPIILIHKYSKPLTEKQNQRMLTLGLACPAQLSKQRQKRAFLTVATLNVEPSTTFLFSQTALRKSSLACVSWV